MKKHKTVGLISNKIDLCTFEMFFFTKQKLQTAELRELWSLGSMEVDFLHVLLAASTQTDLVGKWVNRVC